jgi:hypothetical protein
MESRVMMSTTIAAWNFDTAVATTTHPSPSTGTGTSTSMGMLLYPSSGASDKSTIASPGDTADTADTGSTNNAWEIVGNNGWTSTAALGTQGAQFNVSTASYNAIGVQFDWICSTQGEGEVAVEYSTDGSTWQIPTASQLSVGSNSGVTIVNNNSGSDSKAVAGGYFKTTSTAFLTNLTVDLSGVTAASNDSAFEIRLVNATTGTDVLNPGGSAPTVNKGNWNFDDVRIISGPIIATNPTNQTVTAGNTATFTAAAIETSATVQWMVNSGSGFTAAPGSSIGNTYSFVTTSGENNDTYEAVYTLGGVTTATTAATLTVVSVPTVQTNPSSITVAAGSSATFSATASSYTSVQWYVALPATQTTFTAITGATSPTYTFYPTETQTGDIYQAQFSAPSEPTATTTTATLTVTGTPITLWTLPNQATSPVVAPQPAPTIGTGSATPLGMTNTYNLGAQSYPEDDITATPGVGDPSFTENLWRIRGGSGAGATGSPGSPEGWSSEAPEYTQGAEFDVSTVGYTNITIHADWYSTGSGVRDLQPQYNLNASNSSGWTNYGSSLTAGQGDYYTTGLASVTPTGISLDFQGMTSVENDPNFAIRFVSAYDPALPNIYDANLLINGGVGTHGQYATATPGAADTSQEIVIPTDAAGGFFTLTIGGHTTADIPYDNTFNSATGISNEQTDIQSALAALPGYTASKAVTVLSQDNINSNFIITFANAQTGAITANSSNLTNSSGGPISDAITVPYAGAIVPYTEAGSGNWRFGNIGFYGDTANNTPGIITQPVSATATLPGGGSSGVPTQTFTAAAYSTSADTVQWYVSTNGGTSFTPISNGTDSTGVTYSGATNAVFANTTTTSTLTVTASATTQSGFEYQAVFTSSSSATTNPATLTVVVPIIPTITSQPASVSAIVGNTTSFTAVAQGLPGSTVVWSYSSNGGSTWNTLSNGTGIVISAPINTSSGGYVSTSSTITLTTTTAENGYEYEAAFTNSLGTAYTTANASYGTLTVLPIEPAITQWNFGTAASAVVAAPDNSPAPTIDTAPGALVTVGMNDANFENTDGGYPSVTADDIASTTGTLDTSYVENLLRIRGGTSASTPGAPANGWDALAPEYSQGLEIDVNTTGYTSLYLTYDWYTTAQGNRDLQQQYNLNTSNPAGWTNIGAALIAASAGDYYGSVSGGSPTGALLDLTGISGATNDSNFGIRLVSAYDPGLPLITDSQTVQNNNSVLPSTEPHGQYASATLVNGLPTPLNGSSGNWRFGNINLFGVAALPAWLSSNSIATWNETTQSLVVSGNSEIIGNPAASSDEPNITFNGSGSVLTIATGTARAVNIGSIAVTAGNSVVMTSGTTTQVLVDQGAFNIASGSTFDIGSNFLDLQSTTLTAVDSDITGGELITSDNTLGYLGSIGAIVNQNVFGHDTYGSGTSLGLFDSTNGTNGVSPGANDVLVRYTYFGDANLDGQVDGSDYTLIDNGSTNRLTGWGNGDFNYDGAIDGSDYTLIDNAYNTQGARAVPASQILARAASKSPFATALPASQDYYVAPTIADLLKRDKVNTLVADLLDNVTMGN